MPPHVKKAAAVRNVTAVKIKFTWHAACHCLRCMLDYIVVCLYKVDQIPEKTLA